MYSEAYFTGSLYQFEIFTSLSINKRIYKTTVLAEMLLMMFPFTCDLYEIIYRVDYSDGHTARD